MASIRVLIADDHQLFRQGLAQALQSDPEIVCAAQAANGTEVLRILQDTPVDIVIMDLKMPELDGLATAELIRTRFPQLRVILLTSYDDHSFLVHSLRIGAAAYLLKNTEVEVILRAIHEVYRNGHYLSELVTRTLIGMKDDLGLPDTRRSSEASFTDKEKLLLRMICQELTTAEIADRLNLSPRTIEKMRGRLLEKTGAKSTVGLILYLVRNGLFPE